jgi:hypothetical protein
MAEAKRCEFLLVRYVPDAVRGEFVNIGVLLLQEAGRQAKARFTHDWRRVHRLDPAADVEMLAAVGAEVQKALEAGDVDRTQMLHLLDDCCANAVQVTAPQALLAEAPERELERLAEMYVEQVPQAMPRDSAGRTAIVAQMRHAFETAGVWPMMFKKIAVAPYTHPGDPLKIDCGYRPNGVFKLFQAVALEAGVDAAKVLAFTCPRIREGVARILHARTELAAIVEDHLPGEREDIAFALETLKESSIQVATTSDLPQLAETARRELRA